MDFSINREQKMLLKEFERFLKKEIDPIVDDADRKKTLRDPAVVKDLFKKIEPFGILSGPVPEKMGGMGMEYVTTGLLVQKLAEYWGSLWGVCGIQCIASRFLSEIENTKIRDRYLPQVAAGELISCVCITEPDVGSNPAYIGTTLDKTDGGYMLNGNKTWISNGSISDLAIVIATVDKSLGAKGLAAALVDRKQTPYEARELDKMGLSAFPTSELFFDNIFIPEENIIVPPGQALKATMRTFELARSMMSCGSVGFMNAAVNLAVNYAKEREQWGKKIGQHQLVQEMIYEMKVRLDCSHLLVGRALSMMDQGIRCEAESAMGKGYSTEAAVEVTKNCIQIMGGYGLSEEYRAERFYRDASCMTIPDGTTQMQKMIVARELLGLPAFV
jgi:alkylation response protein AidB-like acyl-CoA dehydrogenase